MSTLDKKETEKKDRILAALDEGMVMVHLDARRPGVLVPRHLCGEAHLRLNLSYKFEPPDLTVGEWGVRCTLSFNGSRFKVAIPWSALFAITAHVSKENWLYPDDMPKELIDAAVQHAHQRTDEDADAAVAKPRAILREIVGEKCEEPEEEQPSAQPSPDEDPPKPKARGHLRVIK